MCKHFYPLNDTVDFITPVVKCTYNVVKSSLLIVTAFYTWYSTMCQIYWNNFFCSQSNEWENILGAFWMDGT